MIAIDSEFCEPGDGSSFDFTRIEVVVSRADGTGTPVTRCATLDPTDDSGCDIISASEFPLLLPVESASGEGILEVRATLHDGLTMVACAEGTLAMDPNELRWGYLVLRRPCGAGGGCASDSVEAMDWTSTGDLPAALTCVGTREQPVPPIERIAVGDAHACLVDSMSNLYCWGDNQLGQLGQGGDRTDQNRPTRVQLGPGSSVRDLAAGRQHTCVLEDDGGSQAVRCFGDNAEGQLGNGMVSAGSGNPIISTGTTGAREISLGPAHSCARMSDGSVLCWGSDGAGESSGTVGAPVTSPTAVPGVADVIALDAGGRNGEATDRHTCAALSTGGVTCWGGNSRGQLGRDLMAPAEVPGPVTGLETTMLVQLGLGGEESCATTATGELYCWGRNEEPGTLGIDLTGTGTSVLTATAIRTAMVANPSGPAGSANLSTLGASELWRCFVDSTDSRVYCLGTNLSGRLGSATDATSIPIEVPLPTGTTFQQVETGGAFACALPSDGTMPFCWGNDSQSQLGDGPGGTGEPTQITLCE